jgi:DNA-directed RNA polymerase subunit RPC12/RpoP
MQTVTFQCGHCGKLIAVGAENLSRMVRCPYCQGVVLTEAPAIPSETATSAVISETSTPLSTTAPEEAAAGMPAEIAPQSGEINNVEFASGIASLASSVQESFSELPIAPPDDPEKQTVEEPPEVASAPWLSIEQSSPADSDPAAAIPSQEPTQPDATEAVASLQLPEALEATFQGIQSTEETVAPRMGSRPAPVRTGVSIWLVIPLISYSVLATTLIVVLWLRLQATEVHPLIAFLPDAEGDAPGVIRKPKTVSDARKRRLIGEPLPAGLKMRIGERRVVGSLAITPLRVAREQIGVATGTTEPVKLDRLSLVLHLRLENVSTDESFQPLDRFFDRKWQEQSSTTPPLTVLEAGSGVRFFGGPAAWQPNRELARNNSPPPEFIYLMRGDQAEPDPIDHVLDPGESCEVFVCTDGNDPRTDALLHRRGDFLWRVQVRRGLVSVKDKEVPAAAVIGIAFTDRDINDG